MPPFDFANALGSIDGVDAANLAAANRSTDPTAQSDAWLKLMAKQNSGQGNNTGRYADMRQAMVDRKNRLANPSPLGGILKDLLGDLKGGEGAPEPRGNEDISTFRDRLNQDRNMLSAIPEGMSDQDINRQFQRSRGLADSRARTETTRAAQRFGGDTSSPLFQLAASKIGGAASAGVGADDSRIRTEEARRRQDMERERRQQVMQNTGQFGNLANLAEGGRQFDADFGLRNDPLTRKLGNLGQLAGLIPAFEALGSSGRPRSMV